jgi:hypothetical protein
VLPGQSKRLADDLQFPVCDLHWQV